MRKFLATFALVSVLFSSTMFAQTVPTLIEQLKVLLCAVPEPPTSLNIVVPAGASIQAALDSAPDGAQVFLTQGVTYTENIVFKYRPGGSVTLRTQGLDDTALPPGMRVTPASAVPFAKIICANCLNATIGFDWGTHDVAIVGVEVVGSATNPDRVLVAVGIHPSTWVTPTTLTQLPNNITFDRVYIHADAVKGGHLGIRMDGTNVNVLNSYVSGFWEKGRDSQALVIINGAGPFVIKNNYLEGSGENFMSGGADPSIPDLVPSDITFTDNYVFKPLEWKAFTGATKNLFELKNAQRVLVEHNVFENNWVDGQSGTAIIFSVRNQSGGCRWCIVRDITFRNNIVKNAPDNFAVNVLGMDDLQIAQMSENITIDNNLFITVKRGIIVQGPMNVLNVRHNTFVGVTGQMFSITTKVNPITGLTVQDNVTAGGAYGIQGSTTVGKPSLDAATAATYVFTNNVIEKTSVRTIAWPAGNYLLAPSTLAGQFDALWQVLNPAYVSTDGTQIGVDISKLPQ